MRKMDFGSLQFRILGSIAISIVSFQIVRKVLPWLYLNVIGPNLLGPRIDFQRLGRWAVVTGATDGIGKSYAKALAKKGCNIVLISRSPTKLDNVAKEISEAYNVDVRVIAVDFTSGPEIYDKIEKEIQGLDVGILVNNVGIGYPHPEFFLDLVQKQPNFLRDIISVNIHSVTHMTSLILPRMVEKNYGVIINVSSTAGVIPNPLLSIYSATKAFVDKFSVDLQTEYKSNGIIIQSVQPGYVATNMTKLKKSTTFAPFPDTYVESALNTVGIAGQTAGYLPHALIQLGIQFIRSVTCESYARGITFNHLLALRKRALRNSLKKK